jgi:hypothetical protein
MEPVFQWTAYEHEHREKGPDWYWVLGIIAVGGALMAIILGNFLFAILILVAAFSLALHAAKPPELTEFEVNEKGIVVHRTFYPYTTLASFWIDDEYSPRDTLIVKSTRLAMPYIVVPIEEISVPELREYLLQVLPEEEMREPLLQKVVEYFGF